MRVCLRRGYHSVYDELVAAPPDGVTYEIPKAVTTSNSNAFNAVRRLLWRAYLFVSNEPSVLNVPCSGVDLIHGCAGILIKNNAPWVIDAEHANSFVGFQAGRLDRVKGKIEAYLRSPNCRKIMPWTQAGMRSMVNYFDTQGFADKFEVVYPAIRPLEARREKHDGTNLLFVSQRFFTKGGRELLEAYAKLRERYDVNLTVISKVPDALKRTYPDVSFFEPKIPRQRVLDEFFTSADVFVMPSYMDTFGMVFLEAMSYSIPIVSTNVFAIPEIIGNCGLMVDASRYSWYNEESLFAWKSWKEWTAYVERTPKPELVDELTKRISALVEDRSLRERLGRAGRKEIEIGKFSVSHRNAQLKRIYEEAVR